MAVRIENGADINFGTFGEAANVSHIRVRRASDNGQPVVKALATAVAVGANQAFQIPAGSLDFLYIAGDMGNTHMQAVVEAYWGVGATLSMEVDAMTDDSTPVGVSGYSQQSVADWDLTTESDP